MRAYIKTYGCSLNQADSAVAKSILAGAGIEVSESAQESDIVIINSCTVKNATAQKILYELDNLRAAGRKVIVTGCMAGANRD
ncbi:2-methylthioadenine synthetase, partial [Candidatus Marsarchaeota archaeon]|nr:2-methylthioadenine synthetase [Candidatus Marsarchaeota archaeon]